jgi:MFS family permease
MYIAELAPPAWRGRLVGFFQVNIVFGILLAYISNAYLATLHLAAVEWRWQLGVSGIPAALFLAMLFLIPRSPRWLLTQSREAEPMHVLHLIGVADPHLERSEIVRSLKEEGEGADDSLTSRRYRLPVLLALSVGMFSQLMGINAVLYYLNDIFSPAGASRISGNLQAIAVGGTNLVATLLAMSIIDKFGRRKLLLTGTVGLILCLSAIGYTFYTHTHLELLVWLLMGFIACLFLHLHDASRRSPDRLLLSGDCTHLSGRDAAQNLRGLISEVI